MERSYGRGELRGVEPLEPNRRGTADVWVALGTIAIGVALAWMRIGLFHDLPRGHLWQLLLPLAVVSVAALWRQSSPLASMLVGTAGLIADFALNGGSLGTLLIYTNVLYDAARFGRPRFARILLGLTIAATVAVAALSLLGAPELALIATAGGGLMFVLPVLTGLELRHYRERAVAERLRADQTERLAESARREAVTAERARMARELHDVIANHLSAIAIHATGVEAVGGDSLDPRVRSSIRVIRENSVQGLAEMRQMIEVLREPGGHDDEPARPRLEEVDLLVRQARDAGLDVRVTGSPTGVLPVAVDLAAYRIVQESLTNALKHGSGGRVDVRIEHRPNALAVTVDSAAAPQESPPDGRAGYGLIGMRERVTLLGGEFAAGPHGGGFRVRAELPA
jgi:signal transduction histidine kinase